MHWTEDRGVWVQGLAGHCVVFLGKALYSHICFNLVSIFYFSFSAVKRYDALAALGAAGMVDIQNLVKWIGKVGRYEGQKI